MSEAMEFFLQSSVNHARTMPLTDSVRYLRGLLEVAGDHPAVSELRHAFVCLTESDRQLELISVGQMKLPLPAATNPPKES